MTALVLQGNARQLPLAGGSVDLIVTSPPYFALRSYTDAGVHYPGQIGDEPTPGEFLDALLEVTAEAMRVLKPTGSLFVNLGDKYVTRSAGLAKRQHGPIGASRAPAREANPRRPQTFAVTRGEEHQPGAMRDKSLMLLPQRYAIRCMDELGLILRAEIIWEKPNGIPESVTDRVRRSHEQWFHFTAQPRYFAAMDEIREKHSPNTHPGRARSVGNESGNGVTHRTFAGDTDSYNPLGKRPGSVWSIPTEPLTVPPELAVEHFAAFPSEWPRRLILGWSPTGICTVCGEPRRPVTETTQTLYRAAGSSGRPKQQSLDRPADQNGRNGPGYPQTTAEVRIVGYSCDCTPFTDHLGTGEPSGPDGRYGDALARGEGYPNAGAGWAPTADGKGGLGDRPRVGPWREYHLEGWEPPPSRPAVVLDLFGGTGTVAMVAHALGRTGISIDLSHDYGRIARWRTNDRDQLAKVHGIAKAPEPDVAQLDLF